MATRERSRAEFKTFDGQARQRAAFAPAFVLETADAFFGEKQFMPLSAFMRKFGLDRKTVMNLVASKLLDVFEYRPGTYRKILVSKASFVRFLKATSLRRID